MRSALMISFLSTSIAISALAQTDVSKKPADETSKVASPEVAKDIAKDVTKDVSIEVVTTVGPKRTYTVIKKQPDGSATFEMNGAEPEPIVRKLSSKDLDFIVKKVKELPVVEKLPSGCLRFQMEVTTLGLGEKFAKRQGCIGQKTNTSAKFEDFTKVLEAATL